MMLVIMFKGRQSLLPANYGVVYIYHLCVTHKSWVVATLEPCMIRELICLIGIVATVSLLMNTNVSHL